MKKRAVSLLLAVVLLLTLLPWGAVRASAASPFTSSAALTPEEAVEIYARDKDVWMCKFLASGPFYHNGYTFLDFDGDGVLELMSEHCSGSSRYSDNQYFKIDLERKTVVEMQKDKSMSEHGEVDGVYSDFGLYRNRKSGKFFYMMADVFHGDWLHLYSDECFMTLENGALKLQRLWGYLREDISGGRGEYKFTWYVYDSDKKITVSEKEYEACKAEFLKDYDDLHAITTEKDCETINALTGNDLKEALLELYLGFSYDWFNEYTYRADYICDYNGTGTGGMDFSHIESLATLNTPGRILAKSAYANGYGDAATAWKILEKSLSAVDNPFTTISDLALEQKDIYTAILLDAFATTVELEDINLIGQINTSAKETADFISEQMKAAYGLDLMDTETFRNLSKADIQEVQKKIDEAFEKEFPLVDDIDTIIGFFDKAISTSTGFLDVVQTAYSYVKIYEMSDSMKEVLRELRAKTPNDNTHKPLRQALDDCISILSYSQESYVAAIAAREIASVGGKYIFKEASKCFMKQVQAYVAVCCPAVNVLLAGAKAGMMISNYLFQNTAAEEQYFKLLALLEVEKVADSAVASLKRKYLDNKTEENAHAYLDAIDLRYKLLDMECDGAYSYVDKVDESLLSALLAVFGVKDNAQVKQSIKNMQSSYKNIHRDIRVLWVSALEKDYPHIYPRYAPLLEAVQYPKASYKIACPVDVYVYDAGNRLVASVEQERPYASGNITVSVENTVKCIDIYDEQQYKIVCRGYASGEMDVSIAAFANGEKIRTAQFYDLALAAGKTYEMTTKRNPSDKAAYTITPKQGSPIAADFDSLVTDGATYTVTVKNGYIATANGPANVWQGRENENAELFAFVPKGYRFAGWKVSANSQCLCDSTNWQTTLRVPGENIVVEAVLERGSSYSPFLDVTTSDWFYEHVMYAFNRNLVYGVDSTHFAPYKPMTRCQLVAILYRLEGTPAVSGSTAFTDLEKGQYYVDAVTWATQNGIVYGVSGTKFDPHGEVTRQQIVTFLYRYAKYKGVDVSKTTSLQNYTDYSQLHNYAKPAMEWAVANGVVYGTTNTTLSPLASAQRAQVAAFLMRLCENCL